MLQKEFETRTGVQVSASEYAAIDTVYMNSDLDKDEFCKLWSKMNANRVKAAKEAAKAKAKWDALTAAQKAFAFIRQEAAKRSEQTGSEYPVSDTEYDLRAMKDLGEYESFTLYFVLRDTGADVSFSAADAEYQLASFKRSNAVLYILKGNRCLDLLNIEEAA